MNAHRGQEHAVRTARASCFFNSASRRAFASAASRCRIASSSGSKALIDARLRPDGEVDGEVDGEIERWLVGEP